MVPWRAALALMLLATSVLAGCSNPPSPTSPPDTASATPTHSTPASPSTSLLPVPKRTPNEALGTPRFTQVTKDTGIASCAGAAPAPSSEPGQSMPDGEPVGPALAWGDANKDNHTDLLVACPDGLHLWLASARAAQTGKGVTPPGGDGITFMDATASSGLGALRDPDGKPWDAISAVWGDLDGDRCLDLAVGLRVGGVRVAHNDCQAHFTDATDASGLPAPGSATTKVSVPGSLSWVDFDRDARLDLFVPDRADASRDALWHNIGSGVLADATAKSGLVAAGASTASTAPGTSGTGSSGSASGAPARASWQGAWADLTYDIFPELLVARSPGAPVLLKNLANGGLRDVAKGAGVAGALPADGATSWAVLDADADGFSDVASVGPDGVHLLVSQRNGAFKDGSVAAGLRSPDPNTTRQPFEGRSITSADVNNDGWPDLVVAGSRMTLPGWGRSAQTSTILGSSIGIALLINARGTFTPQALASDAAVIGAGPSQPPAEAHVVALATADLDLDGRVDLAYADAAGGIHVLRNEGLAANAMQAGADAGSSGGSGAATGTPAATTSTIAGAPTGSPRSPSWDPVFLNVRLTGNQSNTYGIGARLTVHQDIALISAEATAQGGFGGNDDGVIHFGLGHITGQIDALDIDWPSGVHQVLTSIDKNVTITVHEDSSSKTSCPLLFVWDGVHMHFVSDVTGNAYTGWLVAPPDVHHPPDPDELIRVDGMVPDPDGFYDVRLLETLEETDYVDHAQLVAIDHPVGFQVIPDEGFHILPPFPEFGVATLVAPHNVASAVDGDGRDWTQEVSAIDRTYPMMATLPPPKYDGYGQTHTLTLDLGGVDGHDPAGHLRLSAWGWIYYPMVVPRLVVEGPYIAPIPPQLDALDPATGEWVHVADDIGFPAGLPKWWSLDLTGKLPAGSHVVRITTNLRVYWDQFLVDGARPDAAAPALQIQRIEPSSAELRFAGYPLFRSPDGKQPALYDYDARSSVYIWRPQAGQYTRYGDVTPLLQSRDDMFATYGPGDELRIRYDPSKLAPVAPGMERTLFLWFDLFTKDTEPYNAYPDTVEPLPFHAMGNYPYGPGTDQPQAKYPDDQAHRDYLATYQTRTRSDARLGPLPHDLPLGGVVAHRP